MKNLVQLQNYVYFGRAKQVKSRRQEIKRRTLEARLPLPALAPNLLRMRGRRPQRDLSVRGPAG